jgi:hypothetical protein
MEAQLIAHVGGSPTITQKILIERIVKTSLQLRMLDAKLTEGKAWTDIDARTHAGLINRERLLLREIGLKATVDKPDPFALLNAIKADIAARRAAEASEAA